MQYGQRIVAVKWTWTFRLSVAIQDIGRIIRVSVIFVFAAVYT